MRYLLWNRRLMDNMKKLNYTIIIFPRDFFQ